MTRPCPSWACRNSGCLPRRSSASSTGAWTPATPRPPKPRASISTSCGRSSPDSEARVLQARVLQARVLQTQAGSVPSGHSDPVANRLPVIEPAHVIDEQLDDALVLARRQGSRVRAENDVGQLPERATGSGRLLRGDIERRTGQAPGPEQFDERALVYHPAPSHVDEDRAGRQSGQHTGID